MRSLVLTLSVVLLLGCSEQMYRETSTFHENSAGGTYDVYWAPIDDVARWAQTNCARYGKNALLIHKDERQATFECR